MNYEEFDTKSDFFSDVHGKSNVCAPGPSFGYPCLAAIRRPCSRWKDNWEGCCQLRVQTGTAETDIGLWVLESQLTLLYSQSEYRRI